MKLTVYCILITVCSLCTLSCKSQRSKTTTQNHAVTSAPTLNKTFNFTQINYDSTVTSAEVNRLGKYLLTTQFADGDERTTRLERRGNTYLFQVVIKPGLTPKPGQLSLFKALAIELSHEVFEDAQVDVHLCDQHFRPLALAPMYVFGSMKEYQNVHLYYHAKVPIKLVNALGNYLGEAGLADDGPVSVQLTQRGKSYRVKLVVKQDADQDENVPIFQAIPQLLSQAVFNHKVVEFQVCDSEFNALMSFKNSI